MTTTALTDSLRETLAFFETGRPQTTSEIAEALDLGRRSTYDRLDRLVDQGRLETKKVGANARVWWRPTTAAAELDPDGAAESLVGDVLERIDAGIIVMNEAFEVAWANETIQEYLGLDPDAIVGRDKRLLIQDRIAPMMADSRRFEDIVIASYEDNEATQQFECHVTPGENREERWLEHRSRPIEAGEFAGGRVELYFDITERKRTEQAREGDRAELTSMVEAVEEYAIFSLDPDGRITTWNPGAAQIKGYDGEEIIGEHFSTFYTEDDREAGRPAKNLQAARENGSTEDEGWRVRNDGSTFWSNVTISAIRDDEGELTGYAKVTRDMTARHEREQSLEEQAAFIGSIFHNQRDAVYTFDRNNNFLRWNDRFREVTGYTDEEIEEMQVSDFIADEGLEAAFEAIEEVFVEGNSVTVEIPVETADGEIIPYEVSGSPITDEDGTVTALTGVGRDIRDRKARERELERRREDLEAELDDVFTRIDDAFYGVDEECRFTYVNERAEELLGHAEEELLGRQVWEVFPKAAETPAYDAFQTALETGEATEYEIYLDSLNFWVHANVYPSETGLSVYFRDVTEQKERTRELERYETITETVWDGIAALNADSEFTMVNEAYCRLTGYDREELLGEHVTLIHDDDVEEKAAKRQAALEDDSEFASIEFDLQTKDGDRIPVEGRFGPFEDGGGGVGRVGVIRDVSERKARERKLAENERRYRKLIENFPDGAVGLFDEDMVYTAAGGELIDELGIDPEEVVVQSIYERYPQELLDELEGAFEAAKAGETNTVEVSYHDRRLRATVMPVDESEDGFIGMIVVQDVTDRRESEHRLEHQVRESEVVAALGQQALENQDLDDLMAAAAEQVAETLDNDYCKVLDLHPEDEELLLRQGVGWQDGIVGQATVSSIEDDSQAAYTLASEEPVVVEDLGTEPRFRGPDLLTDQDVVSGISVIIGPYEEPWGILGTHDSDRRSHSEEDVNFVQSVANILATAINRHRDEQSLRRQREELEAINQLNEVVQGITSAVIDQSSRPEIEAAVCSHLADADAYAGAWIGEANSNDDSVQVRTQAGMDSYLEDVSISIDRSEDRSQGPTGQALLTGEAQVVRDMATDPAYDPWRERAQAAGFAAAVAIPIVHENTTYGVLNVYTDRPGAFDTTERTVVSKLGDIVGHAIAATERKRALMSDELVELEFHVGNVFDAWEVESVPGGQISFDAVVPMQDDEYLVYGTATEEAVDAVAAFPEGFRTIHDVRIQEDGDIARFEIATRNPPVFSATAASGGLLKEAVIEDGDFHLTVHLSPTADVSELVDSIQETYPNVETLAHRQIERSEDAKRRIHGMFEEGLTDQQRVTLRAAYHAGFFEWPRDVSGQEIAGSLDIAPATFSQHIRKAEKKVFDALFSVATESP